MSKFEKHIDDLVSKVLNEEIESKVRKITETMSGEWTEITVDEELKGGQKKLDVAKPKGKLTKADFDKLRKDKGIKSGKKHGMEEAETEEGNAFTGALSKAKEEGKDTFEVEGKKYSVKESEEKWIQDTNMKKGALHKKLGIPEDEKIPVSKLKSLKKELMKKGEGDKKLSAADSKLLKQVNLALTLKSVKESKNSLKLTESELIDMIEKIVTEQKVKDVAKQFKTEKFLVSNTPGFNSFFLVAGGNDLKTEEEEIEIEGKVTANKLKTAFMKMNKKKQINRVLVSKFIQGIAA